MADRIKASTDIMNDVAKRLNDAKKDIDHVHRLFTNVDTSRKAGGYLQLTWICQNMDMIV